MVYLSIYRPIYIYAISIYELSTSINYIFQPSGGAAPAAPPPAAQEPPEPSPPMAQQPVEPREPVVEQPSVAGRCTKGGYMLFSNIGG